MNWSRNGSGVYRLSPDIWKSLNNYMTYESYWKVYKTTESSTTSKVITYQKLFAIVHFIRDKLKEKLYW